MLHFISKGFVQKLCLILVLFVVSSCAGTTDQTSGNDQTAIDDQGSNSDQGQETASTDETKKPEEKAPPEDTTGTTTGNADVTPNPSDSQNNSNNTTNADVDNGQNNNNQSDPCQGVDVDDHNACTVDSCVAGQVVHTAVDVEDDGNVCTDDICTAGAESHPAKANGTSCADGTVCNGNETCQFGTCAAGTPLACNDGDSCTTDSCNAQTGCLFTSSCSASQLTAVWANEGGDKVAQEELRASPDPSAVINSVWDGTKVKIFGARNEVVNFDLILEAATQTVADVAVSFNQLTGPGGTKIGSVAATGDGLFNWVGRNIELFKVRYLEIKGLSAFCCEKYDERHIPKQLRRPYTGEGVGSGLWTDRPNHNKHYPDIAVPLELQPQFTVTVGQNQGVWTDIYIPKGVPAGPYTGAITVTESGVTTRTIPIELTVRNFTLPEEPTSKTMLYMGYADINKRYLGTNYPYKPQDVTDSHRLRDRHFMMAHRHKISLIDADVDNAAWDLDQPRPEWVPRLDGSLFTAANGYDGPGVSTGNGVYSIGTYGTWSWQGGDQTAMRQHTDAWASWFAAHAQTTEYFLYLIDESSNFAQTEQWASWINNDPGPGKNLMSMATNAIIDAKTQMPDLDIPASNFYVGDPTVWQPAVDHYNAKADKRSYFYNGGRPGSGSFMTEDDGVALREIPWGQYKKGIDRWFYWESVYYNNFQWNTGQTDVFAQAKTYGGTSGIDAVLGEKGGSYSNGDGVMFYPGTDTVYPAESYGVQGPFASLRLKYWRRGIQDVDYLALAQQKDPVKAQQIIDQIVPKVLWEYGVNDPNDPTWVLTDISWSNNPDVWETARHQLADIIEGQ